MFTWAAAEGWGRVSAAQTAAPCTAHWRSSGQPELKPPAGMRPALRTTCSRTHSTSLPRDARAGRADLSRMRCTWCLLPPDKVPVSGSSAPHLLPGVHARGGCWRAFTAGRTQHLTVKLTEAYEVLWKHQGASEVFLGIFVLGSLTPNPSSTSSVETNHFQSHENHSKSFLQNPVPCCYESKLSWYTQK